MTKDMVTETLEDLRARTGLASKFAWLMVSGMTAMCYREKGEATLVEIWRRLLTGEQKDRFLAALDKLEIRDNPPAVTAALYHYFSNWARGSRPARRLRRRTDLGRRADRVVICWGASSHE